MTTLRIAAVKHPVGAPRDFEEFAVKLASIVDRATEDGAEVVVFPEYLALELGATFAPEVRGDLARSLDALQPLHQDYLALFRRLASVSGATIVAGTFLLRDETGRFRNRAYLVSPSGDVRSQDKLQLTGFEKAVRVIAPGDALRCFDARGTTVGVSVCYDSEFPLTVRAQREAGASVLLVPSCTDTAAGATRVAISCLARALENRFFVAKAVTAGLAPWSPALDENSGEAAIYAPMDRGFPDDGIVATTAEDDCLAIATLDLASLEASRAVAQVANDRDWNGQRRPALAQVVRERVD